MRQNTGFNAGAEKLDFSYSAVDLKTQKTYTICKKGEPVVDYIAFSLEGLETRLDALCHIMSGKDFSKKHSLTGTTLFCLGNNLGITFSCLGEEGTSKPVGKLCFIEQKDFDSFKENYLGIYCQTLSQPDPATYRSKKLYPVRTKSAKANAHPEVRV